MSNVARKWNMSESLLVSPACPFCGGATRLIGIEPHPVQASIDICTYGCARCDEVSTQTVTRRDAGEPLN